jgi:hypothetical protein
VGSPNNCVEVQIDVSWELRSQGGPDSVARLIAYSPALRVSQHAGAAFTRSCRCVAIVAGSAYGCSSRRSLAAESVFLRKGTWNGRRGPPSQ